MRRWGEIAILAAMDGFQIVHAVFTALLTVVMGYVAVKARKFERMEDRMESMAKELVASQLAQQTQPLTQSMKNLTDQMERINKRLDESEDDREGLLKSDHGIELKVERRFGELTVDFVRTMATKQDVRDVSDKVGNMATKQDVRDCVQKVDELQRAINSECVQRIERAAKRMEDATKPRPN